MTLDDLQERESFAYFAYGSCMNHASLAMSLGCSVTPYLVGAARLPGYRLAFNYASIKEPVCCANIEPAFDAAVEGALYELPVELLAALELREGVTSGRYARCLVNVQLQQGLMMPALTYSGIVTLSYEAAPSARYRELLLRGLADAGVSESYRSDLVVRMQSLCERRMFEDGE
jgi:cation transport regulator ChaC